MHLLRGDAHAQEAATCDRGRNGEGVGDLVDLLFTTSDVLSRWRQRHIPALVLRFVHLILKTLMGGAAIADESIAAALHLLASQQASS